MYGLPETFDPSFLKGNEIESVCFAAYQVNFYLAGKVWLQVQGRYELLRNDKVLEAVSAFPISQSSLPLLIGKKIVDVSFVAQSGDIELEFEGEHRLFVEGDIGPYESYRLFDGQRELIV